MKKLLVVLLAAMMVLSLAAVSMAATVEGDWRAEWVKEGDNDLDFSKYDLRFNFKGQVSDTVDAYLQIAFDNGSSFTSDGFDVDEDGEKDDTIKTKVPLAIKEYKVTFNQSWGKLTAGFWDHKLFPSRVLLKPHGYNAVNAKDMQFVFDIPVGDAMNFALFMDPTLAEDAMDYDLSLGYKADSFGAELHYGNKDPKADDATYIAFDVYYQVTDSLKAFVYGNQAGDDAKSWAEDLAPVIGAQYKADALKVSFEYALEEASADYTPYGLQVAYGFNNKVSLEVEFTNVDKDDTKIVIRPRVKF